MPPVFHPVAVAGVALVVAAAGLRAQGSPLQELPGMGKPKKAGYVITVDDGEGNTKTVQYSGNERRDRGKAAFDTPAASRAETPRAESGATSGTADAAGTKTLEIEDVDPAVNRFTGKEENLSERRFFRENAEVFGRDEKFDRRDPVSFGKWGRGGESFEKSPSPYVTGSERYETERIEKNSIIFDRKDREVFARSGEKAAVPGWTERFSRDKNAKFTDPGVSSSLRERMADGYKLLTQVSMQDINRVAFRRNHSEEKGALPVGRVGVEGSAPMKTPAPDSGE